MSTGLTSLLSSVADPLARSVADHASGENLVWIDGDWQERDAALTDGRAGAGWLCGLLHVIRHATGSWPFEVVAAPVCPRPQWEGAPVYFGDVVVRADSEVTDLAGLAGRRFAYNEEVSLSGHHMMRARLSSLGRDFGYFGSLVRTGSHLASLQAVLAGEADCAVVDSMVTDVVADSRIRTVESLGPYPSPPIVVRPEHRALAPLLVSHPALVAADGSDYEPLLRLVRV